MSETVGISVLGLGNVGGGLVRLLRDNGDLIRERSGVQIRLASIYARSPRRAEGLNIAPSVLTSDVDASIDNPDAQIVVEVMGGTEVAERCIRRAFAAGKHVVTANKELIAKHGPQLQEAAAKAGVSLRYEASVAAALPVIRVLSEDLVGNKITAIRGIVNGTTNYILTRMADESMEFGAALDEARSLGYAEADPTADIEAYDAQYKLCILSRIVFGRRIPPQPDDIYREGITRLTKADLACARNLGYTIKLLVTAQTVQADTGIDVSLRVHPTLVPLNTPLAMARGAQNAIVIEGDRIGSLLLGGSGAGADPTASAVLADIVQAAKTLRQSPATGVEPASFEVQGEQYRLRPMAEVITGRFLTWPDEAQANEIIRTVLSAQNAFITDECCDHETQTRAALVASLSEARWQEVLEGVTNVLATAGLTSVDLHTIRVL